MINEVFSRFYNIYSYNCFHVMIKLHVGPIAKTASHFLKEKLSLYMYQRLTREHSVREV